MTTDGKKKEIRTGIGVKMMRKVVSGGDIKVYVGAVVASVLK